MRKVYVIITESEHSVDLMGVILSLLGGGYYAEGEYKFIPLIICKSNDNNLIKKGLSDLIKKYNKARSLVVHLNTPILKTEVQSPQFIVTNNDGSVNRQLPEFLSNSDSFRNMQNQRNLFLNKGFFIKEIDKSDRVVLGIRATEDYNELSLAIGLLSVMKDNNIENILRITCMIDRCMVNSNGKIKNINIASAIQTLSLVHKELTVVGCREDAESVGYTNVCMAESLLMSVEHSVKGMPMANNNHGLNYSIENMLTNDGAEALLRLHYLNNVMTLSKGKELKHWRKRLGLTRIATLTESEIYISIENVVNDYLRWETSFNGFNVDTDNNILSILIESLNKTEKMDSSLDNNSMRETAICLLLNKTCEAIEKVNQNCSFRSLDGANLLYVNRNEENYIESRYLFSPTEFFEIENIAFAVTNNCNSLSKFLRSSILDLWEMFFYRSRFDVEQDWTITEILFQEISEDVKKVLCIFPLGHQLLKENIFYELKSHTKGLNMYACSSPLTGFCVFPTNPVSYTGREKDLCERDVKFGQFLYTYNRMLDEPFSDSFRNYIYIQLQQMEALAGAEAMDGNIIKHFEKFRNHIGIDIIKLNN